MRRPAEDQSLISAERGMQDQSEHRAGNHFPDTYSQHHERNGQGHHVSILQNKRYDEYICDDRRKGCQIFTPVSQLPCKYRADQSCKTSENDVRQYASAEDIADKASDK